MNTAYKIKPYDGLLADLRAAHEWYESKAEGLGFEFDRCFFAALKRIADFPAARDPKTIKKTVKGRK